jgi:demethylmenaquinone methyltransferase / 2-methoxy-6-polyprenyl-1,4-benzoquinol methylase
MPAAPPRSAPTPGAPEKARVRWMFDRIAPRYDLLNHLLSAGIDTRWRKSAVDFLALEDPGRVLDLATGTGDLLIEALRRDPMRHGLGVDLSSGMLIRGRRKLEQHGLGGRGTLAAGDGERLPLGSNLFAGALIAFGIRNIGDTEAALRELLRVLAPGGRVVVLEFSMPGGALGGAYRFYFERILPRIGGLVSGNRAAYAYLPASVQRFPGGPSFAALMEKAGFGSVAWRPLTAGIAHLYRGEKPPVSGGPAPR